MIQHQVLQAFVGAALVYPGLPESRIFCCLGQVSLEPGALADEPHAGDAPSAMRGGSRCCLLQ